ncbi:heptosyltransferase-2 [Pustulibacterium marinum]|uniref:Heptosyltransferase-2 n=1 Tax=Pustulibacterium marinum TaxID=1224947 RepID=A0A1I7HVL0_9FLAO|nr:glycosyltransferase family 9 protein [Pustulibacterium marinum]SFU64765.1 heptosyltransferase-2 [Pustulibacterium marinum]
MKFLVIQQKMIGDVLTSTIICDNLKQKYPSATIHFVANDNTLAVTDHHPNIDKVIVFKKEFRNNRSQFLQFLKAIRKEHYDVVIDAYGKLESNLITLASKASRKISYHKTYTSWIYTKTYNTHTVTDPDMTLAIKNRITLLDDFQLNPTKLITKPKIYLSKEEKIAARKFLLENAISETEKIIMISVLGSSEPKTYPATYMAKVIDQICNAGNYTILFNYIPPQEEQAKAIYNLCNAHSQSKIKFNVFSDSLRGFLGIVSHCSALIGNEGGAVNMAKALEVPTFAIFAPFTKKEGWNLQKEEQHKAIHLDEFKPELFQHKKRKEIIQQYASFYEVFTPELFQEHLSNFLQKHL